MSITGDTSNDEKVGNYILRIEENPENSLYYVFIMRRERLLQMKGCIQTLTEALQEKQKLRNVLSLQMERFDKLSWD
jgi:hypothetical protein